MERTDIENIVRNMGIDVTESTVTEEDVDEVEELEWQQLMK